MTHKSPDELFCNPKRNRNETYKNIFLFCGIEFSTIKRSCFLAPSGCYLCERETCSLAHSLHILAMSKNVLSQINCLTLLANLQILLNFASPKTFKTRYLFSFSLGTLNILIFLLLLQPLSELFSTLQRDLVIHQTLTTISRARCVNEQQLGYSPASASRKTEF